jgi:allantoinase
MAIRARRVVTAEGVRSASVHVRDGRIQRIGEWSDVAEGANLYDAGDAVVMAGLVDTHVHCNEPGREEWEGFDTATRAAAAGGITTILDMPLNSIPATTTVAALEAKRRAAEGKSHVNVEFIGGVVPGNSGQIQPLADAGVLAFKCFLSPSGVEEFPNVSEDDLREVLPLLQRTGLPLMVHAEDPACLVPARGSTRRYADYLKTRPADAERSAIEMLVRLMRDCPARVHVVHLSSASSLDVIRAAKIDGLPITVETCPHYLTFAAEDIPDGATQYKCAPPIRSADERNALWTALIDGDIDLIASDHSPCPPAMKGEDGDFSASCVERRAQARSRSRGCRSLDERANGRSRRTWRSKGETRRGVRCGHCRLGSGGGVRCRVRAARAPASRMSIRWSAAAWCCHRDVHRRRICVQL